LTEWIEDHPELESRIHFSDRGTFIIDGEAKGIGTANVDSFLADEKSRSNCLTLDARSLSVIRTL
jgi:hypothetical protein